MIRPFQRNIYPDIDFVWTWFQYQLALISQSRANVSHLLGTGITRQERPLQHQEQQFLGTTSDELDIFCNEQRGELELLTMLELLTTTEAVLRIEFQTRVKAKRKDDLSRRIRKIDRVQGKKVRLNEDILGEMESVIQQDGNSTIAISDFRGALQLRHWLAHGRYWIPRIGRNYAPADVFDISRELIRLIPAEGVNRIV